MTPKQLALTGIGISFAGGGATGIYFITKDQPKKQTTTIKDLLTKDGYIPLTLSDPEWQTRFNELRDNDTNNPKLAAALRESKPTFVVTKSTENNQGGEELKNWCEALLKLEKTKVKGQKNLENAKLLCAKLKESAGRTSSVSQGTGLTPSSPGVGAGGV